MKKVLIILTAVLIAFSFAACGVKSENKADTSLKDGEILLSGKVEEVYKNSFLLKGEGSDRYYISFSDKVQVVEDGYYVVDMAVDSFKGKRVSVICSNQIMESYPAQTSGERMVIIE